MSCFHFYTISSHMQESLKLLFCFVIFHLHKKVCILKYVIWGTFLLNICKITPIFVFCCNLFAQLLYIIQICEYTSVNLPFFMPMGIQIKSMIFFVIKMIDKNIYTKNFRSEITGPQSLGMLKYRRYCQTAYQEQYLKILKNHNSPILVISGN